MREESEGRRPSLGRRIDPSHIMYSTVPRAPPADYAIPSERRRPAQYSIPHAYSSPVPVRGTLGRSETANW
jgi:hypothetical protein